MTSQCAIKYCKICNCKIVDSRIFSKHMRMLYIIHIYVSVITHNQEFFEFFLHAKYITTFLYIYRFTWTEQKVIFAQKLVFAH